MAYEECCKACRKPVGPDKVIRDGGKGVRYYYHPACAPQEKK